MQCCECLVVLTLLAVLFYFAKKVCVIDDSSNLKSLQKIKLSKEIEDLKIEKNLKELILKKELKQVFENLNLENDINDIYEKLLEKVSIFDKDKVNKIIEKLESLNCAKIYDNEIDKLIKELRAIKNQINIENFAKKVEEIKKLENEIKYLSEKKDAL